MHVQILNVIYSLQELFVIFYKFMHVFLWHGRKMPATSRLVWEASWVAAFKLFVFWPLGKDTQQDKLSRLQHGIYSATTLRLNMTFLLKRVASFFSSFFSSTIHQFLSGVQSSHTHAQLLLDLSSH